MTDFLPVIRPVFDRAELDNITTCLESGHVTQGNFVAKFESLFQDFLPVPHAVAVSSGTAALHIGLLALGIGKGDEVLVPSFTFVATANAVELTGATPVFVDVQPREYNIDIDSARKALTAKTKAIIPVHQFGLCADMDAVLGLAGQEGLMVIEDAACATGSQFKGRAAGSMGDLGCFSFHPRKVITTGEGGMLTTRYHQLAETARQLRNHGARPLPGDAQNWQMAEFDQCGLNYRMSDILGAVGCAQMEKVTKILAERKRIAQLYMAAFQGIGSVELPTEPEDRVHSWQSFVIFVRGGKSKRNAYAAQLADRGVQVRCGTHAVHRLHYYAQKYGLAPQSLPGASLCEDCTLTLPVVHGMTEEDVERVATVFRAK